METRTLDLGGGLVVPVAQARLDEIVIHDWPDPDCLAALVMARTSIPGAATAAVWQVPAGTKLDSSDGKRRLWLDVGGGAYDHHDYQGRSEQTSSTAKLARALGLSDDPGWKPIIEMITAGDNMAELPLDSTFWSIKDYPFNLRGSDNKPNWPLVYERCSELLGMMCARGRRRAQGQSEVAQYLATVRLPNGLVVGTLFGQARLLGAAHQANVADVLVATERFPASPQFPNGTRFVIIQCNRRSAVMLGGVAGWLRHEELRARGVINPPAPSQLTQVGPQPAGRFTVRGSDGQAEEVEIVNWYCDATLKMVALGTRTNPVSETQRTCLPETLIGNCILQELAKFPKRANWRTNGQNGD